MHQRNKEASLLEAKLRVVERGETPFLRVLAYFGVISQLPKITTTVHPSLRAPLKNKEPANQRCR